MVNIFSDTPIEINVYHGTGHLKGVVFLPANSRISFDSGTIINISPDNLSYFKKSLKK